MKPRRQPRYDEPREILPDHAIPIPAWVGNGKGIPKEVREANERATAEILRHRRTFFNLCLRHIIGADDWNAIHAAGNGPEALMGEITRRIDFSLLNMTLKPLYGPHLLVARGTGKVSKERRQEGWLVSCSYRNQLIGEMRIGFRDDGKIEVAISILVD